jgi:hypothetical protein
MPARTWFFAVAVAFLLVPSIPVVAEEGFEPLFDGKTLTGWSGDPDLWKVEDGMIVGSTESKTITHNSFLATTKTYKDFVLRLSFKLRNGNSGVQVRSKQHPDFVVRGYQADIAESRFTGILYEEGGRGILADVDQGQMSGVFKRNEWNDYEITCKGPRITQVLNKVVTVDYTEKDEKKGATEGIIALQLHVGPKMRIWFKDLRVKTDLEETKSQ